MKQIITMGDLKYTFMSKDELWDVMEGSLHDQYAGEFSDEDSLSDYIHGVWEDDFTTNILDEGYVDKMTLMIDDTIELYGLSQLGAKNFDLEDSEYAPQKQLTAEEFHDRGTKNGFVFFDGDGSHNYKDGYISIQISISEEDESDSSRLFAYNRYKSVGDTPIMVEYVDGKLLTYIVKYTKDKLIAKNLAKSFGTKYYDIQGGKYVEVK